MSGINSPENFSTQEMIDLGVHERDSIWTSAISEGMAARNNLANNWDNMLPSERVTTTEIVSTGQSAQQAMYATYGSLPRRVLTRMVEDKTFPSQLVDEDTLSAATLGLFEAMHRWDGSVITNFRAYASHIIKTSVINHFAQTSEVSGLPLAHHVRRAIIESINKDVSGEELVQNEHFWTDPLDEMPVLAQGLAPTYTERFTAQEYLDFLSQFDPTGREIPSDTTTIEEATDEAAERNAYINGVRADQISRVYNPVNAAMSKSLREIMYDVLKGLPEQHSRILILRFGIDSGQPRTLAEVGEMLDLSRERARQIESFALATLRSSLISANVAPSLMHFLEDDF